MTMFSATLLACLYVFIPSVDLNMADPSLTCNRGIYQHNKKITKFPVTQENCNVPMGPCEECFPQCLNYTEKIINNFKKDVSGPFNVSWMMNGRETTYLMEYGIQPSSGILLVYYAFLHFSGTKELPMMGWYKVILQCEMTDFARVSVTLLLPSGNRTRLADTVTFSTRSTTKVSNSVSVPLAEQIHGQDSGQDKEPVNTGIIVASVLGASLTIFIISAAVYMKKAVKLRNETKSANNIEQIPNNQGISRKTQEIMAPDTSFGHAQLLNSNNVHTNEDWNINIDDTHHCTESATSEPFQNIDHTSGLASGSMSHDCHSAPDQYNGLEPVPIQHPVTDDMMFLDSRQQIVTDCQRHQHTTEQIDGFPPHIQMKLQFFNSEP